MQLKQLVHDDDAVSPVIGVILMVAITVILAAVIGTFVLGLGDQVQTTAPSTQFSNDVSDANLTFSVEGGQSVEAGLLSFSTTGEFSTLNTSDGTDINSSTTWVQAAGETDDYELSAGDSLTIEHDDPDGWDNDGMSVVWEDQGQSSTLAEYEP